MKQALIIVLLCFYSMNAMDQPCNPSKRLEAKRDPEFSDNIQFLYTIKKQQKKLKDKMWQMDAVIALVQQHQHVHMTQFLEEEKRTYNREISRLDSLKEDLLNSLGVAKIIQKKTIEIIEVHQ